MREHSDSVERHQRFYIFSAFVKGIDQIQAEHHGKKSEEPLSPRIEVRFVIIVMILQIGRIEQRAEDKEQDNVADDKNVLCKRPRGNGPQAVFPPPEVDHQNKNVEHKEQVYPERLIPAGMLDKLDTAVQQSSDSQTQDNADDRF